LKVKNPGGSAIGSNEIHAMLRLSAEPKIAPAIEQYPMKEVDRARANRVRYRAVLANEN